MEGGKEEFLRRKRRESVCDLQARNILSPTNDDVLLSADDVNQPLPIQLASQRASIEEENRKRLHQRKKHNRGNIQREGLSKGTFAMSPVLNHPLSPSMAMIALWVASGLFQYS